MPKKARQRRKAKKAKQEADDKALDDPKALKEIGVNAFKASDSKKAAAYFTRAIESILRQTPETQDKGLHLALLSNRSACFVLQNKYIEALNDASSCVDLDPSWAKGYVRKGVALSNLQRHATALEAFSKAKELDKTLNLDVHTKPLEMTIQQLRLDSDDLANLPEAGDGERNAEVMRQAYGRFFNFMRENGAKIGDIYVNLSTEGGRGVHVRGDVGAGSEVLRIPEKMLITMEMVKKRPLQSKIIASGYKVRSQHSFMALYLLEELHKGQGSFWHRYLQTLPLKRNISPVFYPPSLLKLLANTITLQTIRFRAEALRDEYTQLSASVPEVRRYSLMEFMWARCCVLSRVVGLRKKTSKFLAMVPLVDMVNHGRPSSVHWGYDDGTDHVHLITNQYVKQGQQIYVSYGKKPNSRYFVNYGFTLAKNPENECVLAFSMDTSTPHYQEKLEVLRQKSRQRDLTDVENCREFSVNANARDMRFRRMASFLRFTNAAGKDFELFRKSPSFDLETIGPVSISNEIKMLKMIEEASTRSLKRFSGDLATDHKMLKANRWADEAQMHCVRVRANEREVLRWYQNLAQKGLQVLTQNWEGVRKSNIGKLKEIKEASIASYILTITPLLTDPNVNN